MRKINKDETPDFWKKYVTRNKSIHYDSADQKMTLKLRIIIETKGKQELERLRCHYLQKKH